MKTLLPFLLLFPYLVSAWGTLGHTTVAYIASNLVDADTTKYFQGILGNETGDYLAGVATWADSFRYTAAGRFSAPFHFIDAVDHPPRSCGLTYKRDCGLKGCVVGAINNYTSQILDKSLSAWERNMAARFIVHFVGDIHQPLHDEGLDAGGNGILANFSGVLTNLHHIWDSNIPEKLIGGYSLPFAYTWATILTTSILHGDFAPMRSSWLLGIDLADPIGTSVGWAAEANLLVCTKVIPMGVEGLKAMGDLSGAYYEANVPVVEMQIARAGVRLARWLDLIAAEGKGVKDDL